MIPLDRLHRSIAILCALFAARLVGASAADHEKIAADLPRRASLPNVVILLADDLGYGDPGCYNPRSKIPTPHIDRLAREGMRFTDAHAPGAVCHPSRYGLLTGRYPFRTDTSVWPTRPVIDEGRTTIASMLRAHGYRTAMVGKWHLGFAEKGYDRPLRGGPIDRGFEHFFGLRASTDIPPYFYIRGDRAITPPTAQIAASATEGWTEVQGAFWREGAIAPGLSLADVLPRIAAEAVNEIREHAAAERNHGPLLLYVALTGPHTPWLPADEFIGASRAGLYGDFTTMVDATIGRILQALESAGMAENTLVFLGSDNGPVWFDEDIRRFGHDAAGGLRGIKGDLWEGGHRVPFIVRWPGTVKPDSRSSRLVCFTDVLATLADIVGAPLDADEHPDGFSFMDTLHGALEESARGPLVIAAPDGTMMVRSGPWKLIDGRGSGGFLGPGAAVPPKEGPEGQLYNLDDDLGETINLHSHRPDVVAQLKQQLEQAMKAGVR